MGNVSPIKQFDVRMNILYYICLKFKEKQTEQITQFLLTSQPTHLFPSICIMFTFCDRIILLSSFISILLPTNLSVYMLA